MPRKKKETVVKEATPEKVKKTLSNNEAVGEPNSVKHDLPMDEAGFENVSSSIFKFSEENNLLMGILDGFGDVQTDVGMCRAYFIITAEMGRVSFIGGFTIDNIIEKQGIINGDILKIKFLGKGKTAKGHQINMYDVRVKRCGL